MYKLAIDSYEIPWSEPLRFCQDRSPSQPTPRLGVASYLSDATAC